MFEQAIIERLLEAIEGGEFEGEEGRLPSENEVSSRYGVTRLCARKALSSLEEMGYADARKGRGRFLRRRASLLGLDMRGDESFSDKLRLSGRSLRTVVGVGAPVGASHPARGVLGLGPDAPVLEVTRLRIVDGEPVAIHYSYLDEAAFPEAREGMRLYASMFGFFRDRGYASLIAGPSRLSARLPRAEEQETLDCPPLAPLIVLESSTMDGISGRVLQATRTLYRGDSFSCLIDSSPNPRRS